MNKKIVVWIIIGLVAISFIIALYKQGTMMASNYTFEENQESNTVVKYKLHKVSYTHAMELLQTDDTFRSMFIEILKNSVFSAYFFETPPVNSKTYASKEFEFVIVKSENLAHVKTDSNAFTEHFLNCKSNIAVFPNLGKDCILVSPCPLGKDYAQFAHLASFVRYGDSDQVHKFWKNVGNEMNERVKSQGLKYTWLSTSGLGIFWLHVRLDSRPKYYTYYPYKKTPENDNDI